MLDLLVLTFTNLVILQVLLKLCELMFLYAVLFLNCDIMSESSCTRHIFNDGKATKSLHMILN